MTQDFIREIVLPVFDNFGLKCRVEDDAVHLGFAGDPGDTDLYVRQPELAPVLWLRYHLHLYASAENKAAVLETALGLNHNAFFLKFGIDPADGEVVVDAELSLLGGTPSEAEFAFFFAAVHQATCKYHERLAKVRWGVLSPQEALADETGEVLQETPTRKRKRTRRSKLEREVDEVLKHLEN